MKNINLSVICAAAVLASGVCSARDPFPGGSLIAGRVQGSYIRAAPGIFIESGIAQRSMQGQKWVDVAPRDGGTGVMAQVREDMNAERGVEVEIRVAHQNRPVIAPVGERTQVVTVNPAADEPATRRLARLDK